MTKLQRFISRRTARLEGISLLAPAGLFSAAIAATIATLLTVVIPIQRWLAPRGVRLAAIALLAPIGALSLAPVATFAAQPSSRGVSESVLADMHVSLSYTPDQVLMPGDAFTYNITVTNNGPGTAMNTWVQMPLDPNVMVDNFTSAYTNIFVQSLTASAITIQYNNVGPDSSATVQLSAHVLASAPQPLMIDSRAMVTWDDLHKGSSVLSNALPIAIGAAAGSAAPAQPLQLVGVTGPVDAGTLLTFHGALYGGKESISFWLNAPAGITVPSTALGQTDTALQGSVIPVEAGSYTDGQGTFTYTLNTTGLPSGTYSLVAHGWMSGVEGVASFTIK